MFSRDERILNTMVAFVILLVARTARIPCVRTDRQTDRQNETTTVTLSAHARRGLIIINYYSKYCTYAKSLMLTLYA